MRNGKRMVSADGGNQTRLGWLICIVICLAMVLIGRACGAQQELTRRAETQIPDDSFAVLTAAQSEGAPEQNPEKKNEKAAGSPAATPETAQPFGDEESKSVMALKMACLTFDDGPSKNTKAILEILKQHQVPATFFVTAQENQSQFLPLVKEIEEQGHQIALHSATHNYKKIYADTQAFWLDIKQLRQALEPYVNLERIHWLRFPGGSTNTVAQRYGGSKIMNRLKVQAEERGYEWIDWNVCAEDATASHPNAAQILQNIQRDAESRDLCVVLLHDTNATGQTVKALPQIIEWFQQEGYYFCTVEEMYELKDGR